MCVSLRTAHCSCECGGAGASAATATPASSTRKAFTRCSGLLSIVGSAWLTQPNNWTEDTVWAQADGAFTSSENWWQGMHKTVKKLPQPCSPESLHNLVGFSILHFDRLGHKAGPERCLAVDV